MSSKRQLTGSPRAPWLLWMVEMTNLEIVLPQYDILFSVYNCQLVCTLSIPNRWWILQMCPRMQLTVCSRASWQLWMVQMTYLEISLPWYCVLFSDAITNWHVRCLPPTDEGSFKCLQRCSWWAVVGRHGESEWFKWRCLAFITHPILSWQLSTAAEAVYPQ